MGRKRRIECPREVGQDKRSRNPAEVETNNVIAHLLFDAAPEEEVPVPVPDTEHDSDSKDVIPPQQSPIFNDNTDESVNESALGSSLSNSDLMREVVSNHLILKQIFKHASVKDLLEYSLVCKEWNFSSRTVQRENKRCVAKVRKDDLCQDLKKLNTLLKHCVNVPFNGLALYSYSVSYSWVDHTCVGGSKNLLGLFSTLLQKIPFKYLEIGWDNQLSCVAIPLLKRIFKDCATKLEGLSLFELEMNSGESLAEHFEIDQTTVTSPSGSWLPQLRFLEILEEFDVRDDERVPLVKELILAAPKVTKIYGEISSKFLDFICEQNKLEAVKEYLFEPGLDASGDDEAMLNDFENEENAVEEGALHQLQHLNNKLTKIKKDLELSLHFAQIHPKLGRMSISSECMQEVIRENPGRAFGLLSEILTPILTSSSGHLEELQIYHLDLILLTRLKIPPLRSIRHIVLLYCPHLDWALTQVDFSKLFPNLESVLLYPSAPDDVDETFYIPQDIYDRQDRDGDGTYPWLSVTKLEWNLAHNLFDFNRQITKIFPNVKHIIVKECRKIGTTCTTLWTTWPDVESITLTNVDAESVYKSLDPCFTGMSKHQCNQIWDAILDEVDYTDFAKAQARPCIKDLTKLKKFRLELIHQSNCTISMKSHDEVFLTAVTKKCIFETMPQLTFEIVRQTCTLSRGSLCRYSMEHLEPYVTLINPEASITRRRPHVQVFSNYV